MMKKWHTDDADSQAEKRISADFICLFCPFDPEASESKG